MAAGVLTAIGAAGCSLAQPDDTGASGDQVVAGGDVSAVLKSTLVLQGGCTAAKVGPKHLLIAARCVTGNEAFAVGKIIAFTSASSGTRPPAIAAAEAPAPADDADLDGGATSSDASASSDAASPADAGRTTAGSRKVTIAEIKIHPSYAAKCKDGLCGFNKLEASDSPDIAVIILKDELTTVPSIPVDLDPVGQADTLLVVTSNCANLDATASVAPKAVKTIAVPAKSVNHKGSPYATSPQLVSRLASSYVVTAGAGWRATDPKICNTDMGSPLFRGGSASVAGVTANYTTFGEFADVKLPVTIHHTRVDAASRFKIGDWLTTLGVETIHSCSETAGGCVKHSYDGGTPEGTTGEAPGTTQPGESDGGPIGDAGPKAGDASTKSDAAPTDPTDEPSTAPHSDKLPAEEPAATTGADPTEDADAAAPTKKKKAAPGGCSAAPGGPAPTGEMFLGLGLVLGAAIIRRRRAAR